MTVGQRAAAVERTNTVAQQAADEESLRQEEKTERLRKLRLAAETTSKKLASAGLSRHSHPPQSQLGQRMDIDMDHVSNTTAEAATLKEARIANGYSIEELAITTRLTREEIVAVERGVPVQEQHVERIRHALR